MVGGRAANKEGPQDDGEEKFKFDLIYFVNSIREIYRCSPLAPWLSRAFALATGLSTDASFPWEEEEEETAGAAGRRG